MISGIGIDLVSHSQVKSVFLKHEKRFIARIAHTVDIKHAPVESSSQWLSYWASRFAVKEACAKALGTGFGKALALKEIGVDKNKSGQPFLVFSKKLLKILKQMKISKTHVSLSHTRTESIAIVILEK
ncbi:MAG: holo-ACP synthase [Bdellovibrio sp.]|nr:holo-ACP synthase [Bdellovibrio sp.]